MLHAGTTPVQYHQAAGCLPDSGRLDDPGDWPPENHSRIDRRVLGVAFVSDVELKMDISRQFLWRLKMTLTAGFEGTRRYIQYFNDVQSSLPNKAHRTVSLIGIHPEFQKQGLGRLLMEAVHQQVSDDAQSIGVFLDTGNTRYLTFYESLGYERFADIKMGNDLTEVVLFKANPNYVEQAA